MSDLAAAAAALGIPESLVKRSAEARAKEAGISVDDILAGWAGGASPPGATRPDASPAVSGPETAGPDTAGPDTAGPDTAGPDTAGPETVPEVPETVPEPEGVVQAGESSPLVSRPVSPALHAPPVLVGRVERTGGIVAGILGVLVLSLLLGVAAPAIPAAGDGVRSSRLPFTAAALDGRDIYIQQGCASCHTQLVRNIVSDVGLGPVTLADTNQVIGYRRYGPDLGAVGARLTEAGSIQAVLVGEGLHPGVSALSAEELANLIAYLLESR